MTRLFLDDYRNPIDCASYMYKRLAADNLEYLKKWEVVRNYDQFVKWIEKNGLPDLVSFDHDLADAHYHESMYKDGKVYMKYLEATSEKTGMDCAKWLVDYCCDHREALPKYFVHSMNPVGTENIMYYLENFNKSIE